MGRNQSPEDLMEFALGTWIRRGDVKDLKATFGQLVKDYEDSNRELPRPLGVTE